MNILDYIIIFIYFLGSIIIGYLFNKKSNNENVRTMSWFPIALSIIASQISAVTFLGAPGWAYRDGLSMLVFNLTIPLGLWCAGTFLLPYFYEKNYISIYDFLTERFGTRITKFVSVAFIFKSLVVAGVIIYAPALILKELTGVSQYIHIIILSIIAIVYTYYGGIKAVIWTDVFQMIILWGAIIGILILFSKEHGNIIEILSYANEQEKLNAFRYPTEWYQSNTFFSGIIGGTIFHLAYFGTDQVQAQRILTAKNSKILQHSLWFSSIWSVIQMCAFIIIGFYLLKVYQNATFNDPNQIIIEYIKTSLPNGLFGLTLAAILAAVMSSLDSLINSMATVTTSNLINTTDDYTIKKWIIIWGIVIATVSVIFGEIKNPLLEAISQYGSYFLGGIFGVFILGLFFDHADENVAIISLIGSIIGISLVAKFTPISWMFNILIGALFTIIISYIATLGKKQKTHSQTLTLKFEIQALWIPIIISIFGFLCYIAPEFF